MNEMLDRKNAYFEKRQTKKVLVQQVMSFIRRNTRKDPEYKFMGRHLMKEFGIGQLEAIDLLLSLHNKGKLDKRGWYFYLPG